MKKLIDVICLTCEYKMRDKFVFNHDYPACSECGGPTDRLWDCESAVSVSGDECDVTIKHGLCNEDGSPRRYRSKQEIKREEVKRGYHNHVEHLGSKGSDKSKHTTRWI